MAIVGNLKFEDRIEIENCATQLEVFPHNIIIPGGTTDSLDSLGSLFGWDLDDLKY